MPPRLLISDDSPLGLKITALALLLFLRTHKGSLMKTLAPTVPVVEVANEGLMSFLGQPITLFCVNYIYTGIVEGVNDSFVKLKDAKLVYETGPFSDPGWKDAQFLPSGVWYVQVSSIESYGGVK